MIRVSNPGRDKRFLTSPKRPDRLWGPHSFLSDRFPGYFPGVKWPELAVYHPPLSGAEDYNRWSYMSCFICIHTIGRDNSTFTFTLVTVVKHCDNTLSKIHHFSSTSFLSPPYPLHLRGLRWQWPLSKRVYD